MIAQREFEQAVDLVRRGSEFCSVHSDSALVREARIRLESKKKHLIDVLTEELRTDKSVQVCPKTHVNRKFHATSVTSKKLPNVYKSCPKMISLEK